MSFKIEFIENQKLYNYSLFLDEDNIEDEILYINGNLIYQRSKPETFEESIEKLYNLISGYKEKLFVLTLPQDKYKVNVDDFKNFFNRFEYVDHFFGFANKSQQESFINTYSDPNLKDDIRSIIKNADLSIDDLVIDNTICEMMKKNSNNSDLYDELRLCSTISFKDKSYQIPFFLFNSVGTTKVALLSEKIINAIKNNKILVIDDISESMHTILTKNIISYFNSKYNTKAQIIATSQDLLLLDDEFLFRKDQIWFIYKDKDGNYLYSLDDFKDNEKVDARGNVLKRYLKGMYGALPLPNLGGIIDENK